MPYNALGDMNDAMYGELWMTYLDLFLDEPSSLVERRDLFAEVYREATRVTSEIDRVYEFTRAILRVSPHRCKNIDLRQLSADSFEIRSMDQPSIAVQFEHNPDADGAAVMRRLPWVYDPQDDLAARQGLSFVASPRLCSENGGAAWRAEPRLRRTRGVVQPGESLRFWVRWRHENALVDDVITPPSLVADDINLSYRIRFSDRTQCYCLNSFIRIAPEFTFAGCAETALVFSPVPYTSEIFTEWRWYSRALQGRWRRLAQEGSRQFHASDLNVGHDGAAISVAFANSVAERRRLARTTVWAVAIGLLTEFTASEFFKGGTLNLAFIAINFIGVIALTAYAVLDYLGVVRNPAFAGAFERWFRVKFSMLYDRGAFGDAAVRETLHSLWTVLRRSAVLTTVVVWTALSLERAEVIPGATAALINVPWLIALYWLLAAWRLYGRRSRPLES